METTNKEENKEDEVIHIEPVDTNVAKCPKCQSFKVSWVFTKRGVALKCMACGFDTHYWQDVGVAGVKHRQKELEALPYLKKITPSLTFIENTDYGWEYTLEPVQEEVDHKIYDFKVYHGGYKLERVKVAVCQNTTLQNYLTAEENYFQGRMDVAKKLANTDALVCFYFPDDQAYENKVALAYCRELIKFSETKIDRFKNLQYHIPKEVRKTLITNEPERIKEMLYRNLFKQVFEKRYIL